MRTWSRAAAIAVVCGGCGAPPPRRLASAGSNHDDGAGQLAVASVQLRIDGMGDVDDPEREDVYDRRAIDPFGAAYGGFGYGGIGYGGFGYGGIGPWGGIGYGPPPPAPPPYLQAVVVDAGSVEGSVRWKAGGGVAWPAGCEAARVARAGAPVGGAVVYLDGVRSGRALPYAVAKTGGVLVVTECAITPAAQVAGPLPMALVVENGSQRVARLRHERPGGVTTLELDPGGRAQLALERAGDTQVRDGTRAPAWVMAQAHPYYTVTGADGRFALDDVPPGTWDLVVWYPPLVTAVGADGPLWSPPIIERRKVVIGKRALVTADVALIPPR